ncbi:hypothetical protein Pelo_9286 [Pelomyxa schiedti]|nr:hypothetical protein Pelo_9286 [Pelomyxa schiedti]
MQKSISFSDLLIHKEITPCKLKTISSLHDWLYSEHLEHLESTLRRLSVLPYGGVVAAALVTTSLLKDSIPRCCLNPLVAQVLLPNSGVSCSRPLCPKHLRAIQLFLRGMDFTAATNQALLHPLGRMKLAQTFTFSLFQNLVLFEHHTEEEVQSPALLCKAIQIAERLLRGDEQAVQILSEQFHAEVSSLPRLPSKSTEPLPPTAALPTPSIVLPVPTGNKLPKIVVKRPRPPYVPQFNKLETEMIAKQLQEEETLQKEVLQLLKCVSAAPTIHSFSSFLFIVAEAFINEAENKLKKKPVKKYLKSNKIKCKGQTLLDLLKSVVALHRQGQDPGAPHSVSLRPAPEPRRTSAEQPNSAEEQVGKSDNTELPGSRTSNSNPQNQAQTTPTPSPHPPSADRH